MDSVARKPPIVGINEPNSQFAGVHAESHELTFDPGSFRDRTSRVFVANGSVFRTLNRDSLSAWRRVSATDFFREMVLSGQIVKTIEEPSADLHRFGLSTDILGVLKHERIPFVSYPYEWSFSMLREAALLHLRILARAIPAGLILKDASPYNVQFHGTAPVFIDMGSFVPLEPGEPWGAYRQFCELMLFPLLLQAPFY